MKPCSIMAIGVGNNMILEKCTITYQCQSDTIWAATDCGALRRPSYRTQSNGWWAVVLCGCHNSVAKDRQINPLAVKFKIHAPPPPTLAFKWLCREEIRISLRGTLCGGLVGQGSGSEACSICQCHPGRLLVACIHQFHR